MYVCMQSKTVSYICTHLRRIHDSRCDDSWMLHLGDRGVGQNNYSSIAQSQKGHKGDITNMQFWKLSLAFTTLIGFFMIAANATDPDSDENCAYWAEMGECHKVSNFFSNVLAFTVRFHSKQIFFLSSELSVYAEDMPSFL